MKTPKMWEDVPLICVRCEILKPSICFNYDKQLTDEQRRCKRCESIRSLESRLRTGRTKNKHCRRSKDKEKIRAKARFDRSRHRAALLLRIPKWLTKDDWVEIKSIYAKAQHLSDTTGVTHHVDHIYPLRGRIISGLHVPSNLRIITAKENWKKSNNT